MTPVVSVLGLIVGLILVLRLYDSCSVCPGSNCWRCSGPGTVCMTPVVSILGLIICVILVLRQYV